MNYQKFAQVYGIEFEGKIVYVGVTKRDIRQRISKHYQCAFQNLSGAPKLNAWLLTEPKFNVKIIEYTPYETSYERERFWIAHYDCINAGFNSEPFKGEGRPKGCSNPTGEDHYLYGKKVARHIVEASVAARRGKPLTEAHKAAQRAGHARRKAMKGK